MLPSGILIAPLWPHFDEAVKFAIGARNHYTIYVGMREKNEKAFSFYE